MAGAGVSASAQYFRTNRWRQDASISSVFAGRVEPRLLPVGKPLRLLAQATDRLVHARRRGGTLDRRQRGTSGARDFCGDFRGDCSGSCVAMDWAAGHLVRAFIRPQAGERRLAGACPNYRGQSLAVAPVGFDSGTRLLSFPRGFSGTDSGRVSGTNPGLVSNDVYLGLRAATAGTLSHRDPTNRERIPLWNLAGTSSDHGRERVVGLAPHGIAALCSADSWPRASRRRNSEPARRTRRRHVGTALVPKWRFAAARPLVSNR